MSGTVKGGKKGAKTNKAKYGKDFYARIGKIGGQNGTTGGFYANRELASRAGKIGGTISRKPKKEERFFIADERVSEPIELKPRFWDRFKR